MLGRVWGPLAVHRLTCWLMGKQLLYLDFRFTTLNVGMTLKECCDFRKSVGDFCLTGLNVHLHMEARRNLGCHSRGRPPCLLRQVSQWPRAHQGGWAGVGTVNPSELSVCLSSLGITNTTMPVLGVFIFNVASGTSRLEGKHFMY